MSGFAKDNVNIKANVASNATIDLLTLFPEESTVMVLQQFSVAFPRI
jgi:hypothetical protein